MLTRLEVDGFKNLVGFDAYFGPFTCIAGENGAGKSNVFDAVQFLSLLADHRLMAASELIRASEGERGGNPRELFWRFPGGHASRMSFAAEMIVPGSVEDDFNRPATAAITFLRYEVSIGYEPPSNSSLPGRLVLLNESLTYIPKGEAGAHLRFTNSRKEFRDKVITGKRFGRAFISTQDGAVRVHQEGGSGGRPSPASAANAPATVLSTITENDSPTILAAKREMQTWRRLSLEPEALRASDRHVDPRHMQPNGRHLAATLYRVATRDGEIHAQDHYSGIGSRLGELTGLRPRAIRIDSDERRELFTIEVEESPGIWLPARSLSEGTLRYLALCVMADDPESTGLVCIEEPENGIHPLNLEAMVGLLEELAVDPMSSPSDVNPFRQIMVNTHSPGVVASVPRDSLMYARTKVSADGRGRVLSLVPMPSAELITSYLTLPVGAQAELARLTAAS